VPLLEFELDDDGAVRVRTVDADEPGKLLRGQSAPSLAAILPLKVTGRHYGENLARLDVLFSSLLHHAAPGLLDELVIVTPQAEVRVAEEYAANWAELPLRVVGEAGHFEAFGRFTRPWQVRPWQRQQIVKLNAPALTDAEYVLTLDPDVLAVRPMTRRSLLPGGRALLQKEARSVHPQWWRDSAALLDMPVDLDALGMGVTPALLSREILLTLHDRLAECDGRPWMDVLLTSYCDWTEYTLYLLAADHSGLLGCRHHVVEEGDGGDVAPLQVAADMSIWGRETATTHHLERLLGGSDPGLFAVVQSNTGLPAEELTGVVAQHMPVRRTAAPDTTAPPSVSKWSECAFTASRLAATQVYRGRHRIRQWTGGRH
jgi:Family of unknown function (DUF6492)